MLIHREKLLTQYLNSGKDDLSCHDFEKMFQFIQELHELLLFDYEDAGAAPMANQQFMMAIDQLKITMGHMKMADYHQTKGE